VRETLIWRGLATIYRLDVAAVSCGPCGIDGRRVPDGRV